MSCARKMSSIGYAVSSQPANSSSAAANVASVPSTATVSQAQMQYARPLSRSSPQSSVSSSEGGLGKPSSSQGGLVSRMQKHSGFTKQQLLVLKAQILSYRRLKKGVGTLPRELLQAIAPLPLETQTQQMQYARPLNRSSPQSAASSSEGGLGKPFSSQGGPVSRMQKHSGFTEKQLLVLKAQILAFRRLKKGVGTLPRELLQAIAPPPLETQTQQMQYARLLNRSSPQSAASSSERGLANHFSSQSGPVSQIQKHSGFTKQQLLVLKAQILAFSRLKKGDGTLPREFLQAIAPPPLETQTQQGILRAGTVGQEKFPLKNVEEHNARDLESGEKDPRVVTLTTRTSSLKGETFGGDEKASASTVDMQGITTVMKEPAAVISRGKEEQHNTSFAARKYHGPLFNFAAFKRKHDTFGSAMMVNKKNKLIRADDVKDLHEEGMEILSKKMRENIKKIGGLLVVLNLLCFVILFIKVPCLRSSF